MCTGTCIPEGLLQRLRDKFQFSRALLRGIASFHGDLRHDVRHHDSNNATQCDVKMALYCRTICPKATEEHDKRYFTVPRGTIASASSHRAPVRSRLDIDGNNEFASPPPPSLYPPRNRELASRAVRSKCPSELIRRQLAASGSRAA